MSASLAATVSAERSPSLEHGRKRDERSTSVTGQGAPHIVSRLTRVPPPSGRSAARLAETWAGDNGGESLRTTSALRRGSRSSLPALWRAPLPAQPASQRPSGAALRPSPRDTVGWQTPSSRAVSLAPGPARLPSAIGAPRPSSSLARGDSLGGGAASTTAGPLTGPPSLPRRRRRPASPRQPATEDAPHPSSRATDLALRPDATSATAPSLNSRLYTTTPLPGWCNPILNPPCLPV